MKFHCAASLSSLTLFVFSITTSTASEFDTDAGFGGPNATENQIANDRAPRKSFIETEPLKVWKDWKQELTDNTGLSFSFDYTAVLLTGDGKTRDNSSGGMVRFYGAWDLIENGAFVWKIEHRHGYTTPPPSGFALDELGYVGLQEPPFSDQEFRTTNLYWRQRFNGGRGTVVAGFLDATDYIDVYALSSPWLHFMNFSFSTGSATIGLPNDANLGIAAATMLGENFYVIGGLNDTNSDPTDVFKGFDTFFNDHEFFKSVEFGWTTSHGRLVLDNYHITAWHKDKQDKSNVPDGWGLNFSFTRYIDDRWLPFVRGGWADDGGSLLEKSLSVGFGYQPNPDADLLGIGLNWGKPNSDTFGSGLDDQYSAELFYRFNLGKAFAVTADLQYLQDPALNPDEDRIWMANLRGRIVF